MLLTTTKKLCPLFALFIMAVGCGKKASTDSSTGAVTVTNGQITSDELAIQLDSTQANFINHQMERNGKITFPERLNTTSGTVTGKKVSIYYNMDPYFLKDDYEFKCVYKPTTSNSFVLDNCYNFKGNDLGSVSGTPFSIDAGTIIRMEYSGTTNAAAVEASYLVNWL